MTHLMKRILLSFAQNNGGFSMPNSSRTPEPHYYAAFRIENNVAHQQAQQHSKSEWYNAFRLLGKFYTTQTKNDSYGDYPV